MVWKIKTKSYWQNSFINQNQCKQHISVPPLVNSFSSVPVTSSHKGYVKCLLLSISKFGVNLCLLFMSVIYVRSGNTAEKQRRSLAKIIRHGLVEKMKILETWNLLSHMWVHALCSVFRFCRVHWTWVVWLDILLDHIKSIKITVGGCSKEIEITTFLLDMCFPNQVRWLLWNFVNFLWNFLSLAIIDYAVLVTGDFRLNHF